MGYCEGLYISMIEYHLGRVYLHPRALQWGQAEKHIANKIYPEADW